MRIGDLARRSGVTAETIRFYEARGLLPAAQRLANNYRDYGEGHLARLHFIRHCRLLGMTLEDIGELTSFEADTPERCARVHALIERHLAEIDSRIAQLENLRGRLLELSHRCTGAHSDGLCGILQTLEQYDHSSCVCCEHFLEPELEGKGGKPD